MTFIELLLETEKYWRIEQIALRQIVMKDKTDNSRYSMTITFRLKADGFWYLFN